MQTLVVKDLQGQVVTKTEFNSDKEARIAMENVEIAPGYVFEMECKSQSNLCVVDFVEKILKDLLYSSTDYMNNNEIRDYLSRKIESAERLTNSEKTLASHFVDLLYPYQF